MRQWRHDLLILTVAYWVRSLFWHSYENIAKVNFFDACVYTTTHLCSFYVGKRDCHIAVSGQFVIRSAGHTVTLSPVSGNTAHRQHRPHRHQLITSAIHAGWKRGLVLCSFTYIGDRESLSFHEEPETSISILSTLQLCSSLHYALSTAGTSTVTGQESSAC